ncbi:uncharacterized protein LOC107043985 [Diachasma alloeum]|uniref:uncharacterized protein LOC107043985 n=1 Tax=Diachasma alloeum TaxID=454923 RepID=UPI0007384220|nr:uncharacterized protein LOC107043985 [Diachasma alloeum]
MAMNSPGPYTNPKSPRSPRQLPQLPQMTSITGQRSPCLTPQNFSCKSPGTPRVFEFPPEYCPETPNANFVFEDFGKVESISGSRNNLLSESSGGNTSGSNSFGRNSTIYSPHAPATKNPRGPADPKSPVFQFCNPRKNFGKTQSYPSKSPVSTPPIINSSSRNKSMSCGSPQIFNQKTAKSLESGRRNSCLNLGTNISPTTIVTSSSRSPSPRTTDKDRFETCTNQDSRDKFTKLSKRDTESPTKGARQRLGSLQLNKSYGCLNEVGEKLLMRSTVKNIARKSTSDLTEFDNAGGDEVGTEVTVLSSPRRRGSMKGGLAYLASRRGSRDSQASNLSNVSNEDVGPLNFSAHPRGRQRRTSNFLELPDHGEARHQCMYGEKIRHHSVTCSLSHARCPPLVIIQIQICIHYPGFSGEDKL